MSDTVKHQVWFYVNFNGEVELRTWSPGEYERDMVHGPYLLEIPLPAGVREAMESQTIRTETPKRAAP